MEKKNVLLAEDLAKFLLKHPKAVIASSDYLGCDHELYFADYTLCKKGEEMTLSTVDTGGQLVDEEGKFKEDTIYIGHKKIC